MEHCAIVIEKGYFNQISFDYDELDFTVVLEYRLFYMDNFAPQSYTMVGLF